MSRAELKLRLENALAMADNLMKCPANEQNIGNMQACAAQAIRDLAGAIEHVGQMVDRLVDIP